MCNTANLDSKIVALYEQTVNDLTAKGELFTAYDITCILRSQNTPNLPRHYEMKNILHDMFNDCRLDRDYIRTQHVVDSQSPSAFVYHRFDVDVNTYDKDTYGKPAQGKVDVVVGGGSATAPTIGGLLATGGVGVTYGHRVIRNVQNPTVPAGSITNKNTDLSKGTVVADSRGRVHVPKKYLVSLGVPADGVVYVEEGANGSALNLFGNYKSKAKPIAVDCYTNAKVYVGKQNSGKTYKFSTNGNQVTLSR